MLLKLYGVRDEKAEAFRDMRFYQTDGIASRQFSDAAMDPKTYINKHPQDYSLYLLGEFDDETGLVRAISPSRLVARANEFVQTGVLTSEVSNGSNRD